MSTVRITIGLRALGDNLDVPVDVPANLIGDLSPEAIAEACFGATQEPQHYAGIEDLTGYIARTVLPRRELAQIGDMRSMCVGDYVAMGDTKVVCESLGWAVL